MYNLGYLNPSTNILKAPNEDTVIGFHLRANSPIATDSILSAPAISGDNVVKS